MAYPRLIFEVLWRTARPAANQAVNSGEFLDHHAARRL